MSNGDDTLTHKDLAQALGVSETTIKSYRRKFPLFFPLHSQGKPLRFKPQALDVAQHIRQGFLADLSVEEVRNSLESRFQQITSKRNSSSPTDNASPPPGPSVPSWKPVENLLTDVLQAQQYANHRLDALQELLADFLSLHLSREDAFSQGLDELKHILNHHLQRLDEVARTPLQQESTAAQTPAKLAGPKKVSVRNIYGQSTEYEIHSGPQEPLNASGPKHSQTPAAQQSETSYSQRTTPSQSQPPEQSPPPEQSQTLAQSPPKALLEHPLVIRTGAGEYLGVAGKAEGAFSLNDLLELLRQAHPAPLHFSAAWSLLENAQRYRLELEQQDAIRPRMYALEVEPARTPRGNEVTLAMRFETQGNEMPPANIYAFIRQMKQQL